MSHTLWRSLFQDDVDSFRQYLANATLASGAPRASAAGQLGNPAFKIGSPELATSPKTPKYRRASGYASAGGSTSKSDKPVLSRAEINAKDSFGRTILHHAASSRAEDPSAYVKALLQIPFLDLYAQDAESGWTALHRALYAGNISIARALMARDIQDATDYTTNVQHTHAGGLVKIKDHEGNSPFEVFNLTIAPRSLQRESSGITSGTGDDESVNGVDVSDERQDQYRPKRHVDPDVDLHGDEVFAFGSNKNFSLGLGDEDDRHFPERLQLSRPEHLLRRLLDDHTEMRQEALTQDDPTFSVGGTSSPPEVPAIIQFRPLTIQNVVMSKFHTAVLTTDPISNLYVSGFGPGGRLGTGDENTSFTYRCIQGGGLAKRRIAAVALGHDHTIAICSQGEVFTWGSNRFGQLGYALPEAPKDEIPMQLLPRQLYGYIKKELIIGAAASAIHSAVYTSNSLYTFGKNEGQLGLMDADARSLEVQILPRRVGASIFQSDIESVSAIDRATIVLLKNHDVYVFTHYGYTKVPFVLESFTSHYITESLTTKYNGWANYIQRITCGGNTICALSSFGEVFSIEVPKVSDTVPSNVSTTNPTKAKNALPKPTRLWSIRKDHMAAADVAVGQDGSIILCTASGSVWRKEKRANIKSVNHKGLSAGRTKDYKFVRIPNLTGAIAVRSNAYGAFTAVRKDCSATRDQIIPDSPSLWNDLFKLLPFYRFGLQAECDSVQTPVNISQHIIQNPDSETDILNICKGYEPLRQSQFDVWVTSNTTDVRLPVHSFLLKARSKVLRSALTEFKESYYFSIPDVGSIEYGSDGNVQITFPGADFLTLVNFVFYLYTDNVIDVWHYTSQALQSAARYRSVRIELMKLASNLDMRCLERAVRVMIHPSRTLHQDMELAILDKEFFEDPDLIIELADDVELPAHSVLLCARCPFFDGLFNGMAGGRWMTSRRDAAAEGSQAIRVDLKHVDEKLFVMVLRHLYADSGEEIFDDIATKSLNEFLDIVIEVMSVANELMLDRLAQICQKVIGSYVNMRNICSLINTISECSVEDFKQAALEYICLNLEGLLEQRLLDDLDDDLLCELDHIVQDNQLAYQPFARSNRAEIEMLDQYPELAGLIETGRERRIDSMRLRSRLFEDEDRHIANILRVGSLDRQASSPLTRSTLPSSTDESPTGTPSASPAIRANDSEEDDLPFDMDDENHSLLPGPASDRSERLAARSSSDKFSFPDAPSVSHLEPTVAYRQASVGTSPISHLSYPSTTGAAVSESPGLVVTKMSQSDPRKAGWQQTPPRTNKLGLKDIMEQASASRVSNLTQAMTSTPTPSKPTTKLSQKERKRQQQQQKEATKGSPVNMTSASPSVKSTTSPWQNIGPAHKPKDASSLSPPPPKTEASASPALSRPAMTVRQTVAGLQSAAHKNNTPPQGERFNTLAHSPKPATPQIQSIRHTPVASRSSSAIDARTSMADILAQQQTEKRAIKEAAAKRSLQEIQQEQEFQEWWDSESRRVQEEAQAATSNRQGKGVRGRGGARKGSGRGNHQSSVNVEGSSKIPSNSTSGTEQKAGSGDRQQGRTAGRGRGHGQQRGQQRGTNVH